jgi:hypothetical protein
MSNSQDHMLLKLAGVWTAVFAGWTITHWAASAALIYTVLQIVVLVRREFWPKKEQRGP